MRGFPLAELPGEAPPGPSHKNRRGNQAGESRQEQPRRATSLETNGALRLSLGTGM